jgi:gas vesicle protein
MMGFALGAMLGAGLALLLAPAAGAETRRKIGETARRWRHGRHAEDQELDEFEGTIGQEEGLGSDVRRGQGASGLAGESR